MRLRCAHCVDMASIVVYSTQEFKGRAHVGVVVPGPAAASLTSQPFMVFSRELAEEARVAAGAGSGAGRLSPKDGGALFESLIQLRELILAELKEERRQGMFAAHHVFTDKYVKSRFPA